MKKLLVATVAFALALVLRADFTYSNNVFRAIAGTETLNPVNGSWSAFDSNVSWQDGSLAFDLDDEQYIAFTVADGASPDTNTVVQVEMKSVLSLVLTNDFPSAEYLTATNAQLSFLIGVNADVTPVTTNYYAWAGGDWVCLEWAEPSVTDETDFIVTFNYMTNNSHFVQFDIVSDGATNRLYYGAPSSTALPLTSAAGAAAGNVAGIKCYGSGSLTAADGSVGLGIADVGGVKYGSLADANAAAAGGGRMITVLRSTDESVTLSDGVSIFDPTQLATNATIDVASGGTVYVVATSNEVNNGVSGSCTIPLNINASSTEHVVVTLPGAINDHKEVVEQDISGNTMTFALQTKTSILQATNPGGDKPLSANIANLRTFLGSYANAAYIAADVTHSSLEAALQANGGNGIPLWQSYVLGINPTDSIAPVTAPAGDTDANNITLAIPAIVTNNYSGDYTVTYQAVGASVSGAATNSPHAVKAPLTTGTYTIRATLTPQ